MAQLSDATFEFINNDGTVISAHRHINPNGNLGGWVADTAVVGEGAIVELGALVAPSAIVAPGRTVREGQIVTSEKE